MKFHAKCYDRNNKPVVLVVKGEDEAAARTTLLEGYKVNEIVEIVPHSLFAASAKSTAELMSTVPEFSKANKIYSFQKRHNRKKLYV